MTAPDFFSELDTDQEGTPDFFGDLQLTDEAPQQAGVVQPQQGQTDFFAEIEQPKPYTTPYDVEEYTPEQLKAMSPSERLQYAKDLKTERRFRQSKGVVKGILSGASFGFSEKIPGLKPEEGDFLNGFGEFLGSALPISKLYNFLGKPLVNLASKSPRYAEGLQSLARMTGFGLTGAAYEGAKETIKTGEVPTPDELMKYGLQWAAFDGALQLLGKAASPFLAKLKSTAQANGISEKEALNTVIDSLSNRKINIEKDPEKAIRAAQDILDNYPRKMQSAREERIAGLKAKETEAEQRIGEAYGGNEGKIRSKQEEIVGRKVEEKSGLSKSFEEKRGSFEGKLEDINAESNERLVRLSDKEQVIRDKFETDKIEQMERLSKKSDKDIQSRTKEIDRDAARIEKEIAKLESKAKKESATITAQIEKAKAKGEPTKKLENLRDSIVRQKDQKIEKLKSSLDKSRGRLESFKEKSNSSLENKIEKLENKPLPSSALGDIDVELRQLEKEAARQQKAIEQSKATLPSEHAKGISKLEAEARGRLMDLRKRRTELFEAKNAELRKQRESAYKERHRTIPVKVKGQANPKIPQPKPQALVEITGKGAAQRIEYAPTKMDKAIDTANDFIQAAKTPAESLKRLGQSANENIFNALAPLERAEADISIPQRASTRIKMAQSAASEINSVLENGIFSNITGKFEHEGLKGAYGELQWKKITKGLKEHEFSLEELDTYRTSKAALKRQGEGKKTGIDTQQAVKDINRLQKKYEPIDKRIRDFQKATLDHYGKDLLGKKLIDSWNKDYYSPLYRVMEEGEGSILRSGSLQPNQPFKRFKGSERKIIAPSESDPLNASMLIRNAKKNDAVLQYRQLVLDGKLPGKIRNVKNDPIPDTVLKTLDINQDLREVAESLYNQTRQKAFTPEKNILRGWKDGKPFEIEVPEDIYNVFSTLAPEERGGVAKMFSFFNRMFSRGISFEPRKFLSIVNRDALSSLIYSRTGSNPISIPEALADIYQGKPVYKEFLSMGGDMYAARLSERIDRAKKIEDLITPGKEGILVPFEKIGDYFRKYSKDLGDISLSVPLAEYKRALEVYGDTAEGRIMAAMEARRVTYDPTRKGASKIVRDIGNFVPFWNVSLQDAAMLGKNLKNPETWIKGAMAITVPTLLLKVMNESNPEYQALTPVDKAAFWHVYFGDKHLRIPIPWLLGTTFKVGAETFVDVTKSMAGKGNASAKEAWNGLLGNFAENLSGSVPPLLQAYMQGALGKTAPSPVGLAIGTESRAPEVVPRRLQDLPPALQYTSSTSQLARWFGSMWDVSPMKVEKIVGTLGGLVAKDALALVDEMAYFSGLAEDKRPEKNEANYLLLGNFVSNGTPTRTKYANEFYEYLNKATQEKKARSYIQQKGLGDERLLELKFNGAALFAYNKGITQLFKEIRRIEDSNIDAAEKKRKMDKLQTKINDMYKEAVDLVRHSQK